MSNQYYNTKEEELDRHVLRGNGLLRDIMEGKMMGRNRRGRPRQGMISDLKEAISERNEEESDPEERKKSTYVELKRLAGNREEWRRWVPGKPALGLKT